MSFARVVLNKLAKNVPNCVFKNSVKLFMSKIEFFLNKSKKHADHI